MTLEEIAKKINITRVTLYNWKKEKPLLYEIVLNYFKNKKDINDKLLNNKTKELIKYFNELTEEEQEMYLAEIKARALRKKLK